jgi:ATP-binding cassette subfamily B protein
MVWLLVVFVAIDLVRQLMFWLAISTWPYWWTASQTLLRTNVLRSLLCAPGPAASRLPATSGEAVNRFRDDVEDIVLFVDIVVDLTGDLVFAIIALTVLWHVDSSVTLVIILPLIVVVAVTRFLSDHIRAAYSAARRAAASVSELIGALFTGVLTLKVNGAEAAAVKRLRERNAVRRQLEVRARLLTDLLDSITASTADFSTGLVLLLIAPAMRRGELSVGDLALFTAYVGPLANLPRRIGRTLYRQRQASVAGERLARLLAEGQDVDDLTEPAPVYFREPPPPAPVPQRGPADRLVLLEGRGLTASHQSRRGIDGVDLRVERHSFTVVTGAVGSGKTTLLRAVLGLMPLESGELTWNGETVDDAGLVLVPPRAAYAAQVPRLWSATLAENLLLGWPDGGTLDAALRLAALDGDVAVMPDGTETVVGPRGIRLSGGQLQRATVARALVRRPELLVVDDVSSALDVETERRLWDGLAGPDATTCLVVSHRRPVLARADRVVVLDRGRVVGDGPPAELLASCSEYRRLWRAESDAEVDLLGA